MKNELEENKNKTPNAGTASDGRERAVLVAVVRDDQERRAALAIEAAQPDFWHKYVGRGAVIGMSTFGESAPAKDLYAHFNITAEAVVQAVQAQAA